MFYSGRELIKMKESNSKKEGKHWADVIADEVIERVSKNKILQEQVKKTGYFVYDEKTPSGQIHIGSGRGWIIHDAIAKALRDRNKDSRFVLSSDDMDPLDKFSKELSIEENKKYIGVPFRYIPSPSKDHANFGDYFFKQATDKFEEFGIDADLESTAEQYETGVFNRTIKISLDRHKDIQKIYSDLYGKESPSASRIHFNVMCPKCSKITTTQVLEWDAKKEIVYFECKSGVVAWADGCGFKGHISPYNGNGKLPWKVEWAAKWPSKGVIVETAGKDHFTKGGSRTVANRIAVDVFEYPPPYPSNGYVEGPGYEFFIISGKKMSTSKGRGISFVESTNIAPAPMLRYLLIKSKPTSVVDFDPYQTNDLILLYERYDKTERIYYDAEDADEKEKQKQKRIYDLSYIGSKSKELPPQISLIHASMLVQTFVDNEKIFDSLKETGHLKRNCSKEDLDYILSRLNFARTWISDFAEEQYKFSVQKTLPNVNLTSKQKSALKILATRLKKGKWTEDTLYNEFYSISRKEVDLPIKDFFQGAYNVLLNKNKGPRLAQFLLNIKHHAAQLFEEAAEYEYKEPEIVEKSINILSGLTVKEPEVVSFTTRGKVNSSVRDNMFGTRWAFALVQGVTIKREDERLEKIKRKLESFVRNNYDQKTLLQERRLIKWREFQREIGLKPGKERLTPETLIRNVLKGKPMPTINTVVDCANVVSLNNLNPQGAFNLDNIKGNIELRYVQKGESYLELFKSETYSLENEKEIVYADEEKVYSRLHRDSEWTKVDEKTKNLLLQYDAIAFQKDAELEQKIKEFAQLVTAINGGSYTFYLEN